MSVRLPDPFSPGVQTLVSHITVADAGASCAHLRNRTTWQASWGLRYAWNGANLDGDTLRTLLAALRRILKWTPANTGPWPKSMNAPPPLSPRLIRYSRSTGVGEPSGLSAPEGLSKSTRNERAFFGRRSRNVGAPHPAHEESVLRQHRRHASLLRWRPRVPGSSR